MSRAGLGLSLARSGAVAGVCLLATALGGSQGLWAQTPAPEYAIRSWNARDGLPSGLINGIQRTTNGYLWVATRVGLVCFDGARFRLFDHQSTPGLRTNWISSLLAEPGGGLVVGTPDGLFRFAQGNREAGGLVEIGSRLSVASLAAGRDGALWVLSSSNQLMRVVGGEVGPSIKGPARQPIRSMATDATGRLAVACGRALYTVDQDNALKRMSEASAESEIDTVLPSRRGGCWIASARNVTHLDAAGPTAGSVGSFPVRVSVLLEDRQGNLLAGTRNGSIYRFRPPEGWRMLTARRPRSFGGITSLYEDSEGCIWAGTSAGILHQIKPPAVNVWSLPTTVREHIPQTVCVAKDGAVWIGTDGAGAYRCRDGKFTRFGEDQGLGSATVMAILEDRQTNLWFGTHGGLFRLDQGRLQPELESVLGGEAVPALFQDRAGDLWLGTVGAVVRKRGAAAQVFPLGAAFQDCEVRAFAEDQRGVIWIGTFGGGLFRLAEERIEKEERFPRPALTALHLDHEDALWIGTLNNGLFRLHNGQLGHWRTKDGLPGNTLYAILEDAGGTLWLSSNDGVVGLGKQALQAYRTERDTPVAGIHLATAQLEDWSAGSGQPAAAQGPDGRLWFPVGHGVVSFDPAAVARRQAFPAVLLEEVVVDGTERSFQGGDALRVLAGLRRVDFHYTIPDLNAPGRLKFRHKLEGFDDQWVDAGTARVASYGYVPPGQYRFRVIASGSQGGWSEMAPLAVEVVPRLWERRWFQVLSALAILGAVTGIARGLERAKVRRKMQRLELQQTMERERRRIARDLHDDLGAGLTEIMLLGEVARREGASADEAVGQLSTITHKARRLAAAMDEVVWTVNPKNDLVPNLASYLCDYTREFFSAAPMHCRIDVGEALPASPLTAQARHGLFLAVKEALNNAAKHSGASEVWLRIHCEGGELRVAVQDNGRGFDRSAVTRPGNGLDNMRARLEAVGGRTIITSDPGHGTAVGFRLPLPPPE